MIYDLSIKTEIEKLKAKLNFFAKGEKMVELKLYSPIRSIKHNRYLHLILSAYAVEYGDKMEHVKQEIFKKIVNPDIFKTFYVNPKTGEEREDWRSTKDLTDSELSKAINRFKDYSVETLGFLLPDSDNVSELNRLEAHIKNNSYWN